MNPIMNDKDFRIGYEILHCVTERMAENGGNTHSRRKRVAELKRNLRRYAHREIGYERRIVKDYGIDGFVALERLPDDFKSVEEARQFFERFMTYEYRPSMYDCTGQWFTSWFKVFQRNGGYYAYHAVSVDV